MAVNGNCRTTLPINPKCPRWRPLSFIDCLPSSEHRISFFFFGFSLIYEVKSVVINLWSLIIFVCSATVDDCLLTCRDRKNSCFIILFFLMPFLNWIYGTNTVLWYILLMWYKNPYRVRRFWPTPSEGYYKGNNSTFPKNSSEKS